MRQGPDTESQPKTKQGQMRVWCENTYLPGRCTFRGRSQTRLEENISHQQHGAPEEQGRCETLHGHELAKLIPQLSAQSAPLRCLQEQKKEWEWSHEQENCFKNLNKTITEEPVLRFYDPEKNKDCRRVTDWPGSSSSATA